MNCKRTLLLLLLFSFSSTLISQINKGDQILSYLSPARAEVGEFSPLVSGEHLGLLVLLEPESSGAVLITEANYRYAVSDRLLIGSGITFLAAFNEGENFELLLLQPNLRYYLKTRSGNDYFAEASTNLILFEEGEAPFLSLKAGRHWALDGGVLLTPTLQYDLSEGASNAFRLGLGLEFLLGKTDDEQAANASFQKGDLMLGTDLLSIDSEDVNHSINIRPVAYKFFGANTALGIALRLSYTYSRRRLRLNDLELHSGDFGLDLRLRQYFGPVTRFRPFAEASAGYSISFINGKDRLGVIDFGEGQTEGSIALGLAAGVQVFITDALALEAGPAFRHFTSEFEQTDLLSLRTGVRWRLRSKK